MNNEQYKKGKTYSSQKLEYRVVNFTKWIGSSKSLMVHSIIFGIFIILIAYGIDLNKVLLVLTTIVSLEAIYLSIFIQMSVNRQDEKLTSVSEDIEFIQEDVEEIQKDVEGIEKDVDEIQKDVEGIEEDIDEIQEDVEGIEKDIDEIQEDVEEIEKEVDVIQENVEELNEDEVDTEINKLTNTKSIKSTKSKEELLLQELLLEIKNIKNEMQSLKIEKSNEKIVSKEKPKTIKTKVVKLLKK